MPLLKTKITTNYWQNFDEMRKDLALKLTRSEYQTIAELIKVMIILRTREYHLSAECKPFTPYSWQTERRYRSKKSAQGTTWERASYIVEHLGARLASMLRQRGKDKEIAALRAQIGHFRKEINELQKEYYSELAKSANDVDLTRSGRMLDETVAKATSNAAVVQTKEKWGDWIQRGVPRGATGEDRDPNAREGKGTLPMRPWCGITDAELKWLHEKIIRPIFEWYTKALHELVLGRPAPARPNAARLAISALRDKPQMNDELRAQ